MTATTQTQVDRHLAERQVAHNIALWAAKARAIPYFEIPRRMSGESLPAVELELPDPITRKPRRFLVTVEERGPEYDDTRVIDWEDADTVAFADGALQEVLF